MFTVPVYSSSSVVSNLNIEIKIVFFTVIFDFRHKTYGNYIRHCYFNLTVSAHWGFSNNNPIQ